MFGYILPEKPEMKIKEYEMFRAYYCGVCKSIGQRFGQVQRLTLNYDSTFLAILLSSLSNEKLEIKNERCIAHPIQKRNVIKNNEIIDYASDMNIILAYLNLEDNWIDEKSVTSLSAMMLLKGSYKKLNSKYKEKCGIIKHWIEELSKLEKAGCNSPDEAANTIGKLMEEVIFYKPICLNENMEKAIRWIGYNMGKWIYLIDAFDDIEKDIKNKSYNPFVKQYKYSGQDVQHFKNSIKERVEFNLTYSLSEISKSFELLDKTKNSGILENIIYMGMLRKTEKVLNKCNDSCAKRDEKI